MIHDAGRERQKKKTPASASTLRRGVKGRLVRPRTPAATVLAFLSLRAALCESLRMSMCVRESVCVRACCSCVCVCVCTCESPFVPLSLSVHNYFNTHTHTHTHTHRVMGATQKGGFQKMGLSAEPALLIVSLLSLFLTADGAECSSEGSLPCTFGACSFSTDTSGVLDRTGSCPDQAGALYLNILNFVSVRTIKG